MPAGHGPMTDQEMEDMRMAQKLQQKEVQRAQRHSRQDGNSSQADRRRQEQ